MKRMTFGLLAAASLALGACAQNPVSLIIVRNIAPEVDCQVDPDSDVFRPEGFIDVLTAPGVPFASGYLFTPELANGLLEDTIGTSGNNIIFVESAKIELRSNGSADSDAVIAALGENARKLVATSGSIPPGGNLGTAFEIMDSEQLATIGTFLAGSPNPAVQVIARVVVTGSVEGTDVESPPFDYPITICEGCLVTLRGACDQISQDFQPDLGGNCRFKQDGSLDCCVNSIGTYDCPGFSTMMN